MNADNLPTKQNLQKAKINLKMAIQGHSLLDKKHKVLMLEFCAIKNNAKLLQSQLTIAKKQAFLQLFVAKTELREEKLEIICNLAPIDTDMLLSHRILMSVKIPKVIENKKKKSHPIIQFGRKHCKT